MRTSVTFFIATALLGLAGAAIGQTSNQMTQSQLEALTSNGRTLTLGGPGMGYSGELRLNQDGTGKGSATTDAGDKLTITGTWQVRDGQFCRSWQEFNGGAEVCETWILTAPQSVDVVADGNKIGVNSW